MGENFYKNFGENLVDGKEDKYNPNKKRGFSLPISPILSIVTGISIIFVLVSLLIMVVQCFLIMPLLYLQIRQPLSDLLWPPTKTALEICEGKYLKSNTPYQIFQVILSGDSNCLDLLLEEKEALKWDVNMRNSRGETPLMIAAGRGFIPIIESLIGYGADVNAIDTIMGATALHRAMQNGDPQVAAALLKKGALINFQASINGHTPLHDAVWHKKPTLVNYLLAQGVNTQVRNQYFSLPINFADQYLANDADKERRIKMIDAINNEMIARNAALTQCQMINAVVAKDLATVNSLIAQKYAKINEKYPTLGTDFDGFTPLLLAAKLGQTAIVKALLDAGADTKATEPFYGDNVLGVALFYRQYDIANLILNTAAYRDKVDYKYHNFYLGFTPLHYAVMFNQTDIVQTLYNLDKTIVTHRSQQGWTGYDYATKFGYSKIQEILAFTEAPIDPPSVAKCTDIFDGIWRDDLLCVEKLITLDPPSVNKKNADGYTPLMVSVALGQAQMTELLLNLEADTNILDTKAGKSALHFAAIGGYVDVAQFLLNYGSFIDVQAHSNGNTPLMDAAHFRNPRFFEFLLSKGANINSRSKMTSLIAADKGAAVEYYNLDPSTIASWYLPSNYDKNSFTVIDTLIKGARASLDSIKNDPNKLKLFKAVAANNTDLVREILRNRDYNDINEKWPIDGTGGEGYTPLLLACRDGNGDIVKLLLDAGAHVAERDYTMKSATGHKAGYMGRPFAAQHLVKHPRFEIDCQGFYNGYTPLHDATWHGHTEVVRIYLQYKANTNIKTHAGQTPLDIAREYGYTDIIQLLTAA